VVFPQGPLLQKHFSLRVEYENAESPVQQRLPVSFHFFYCAGLFILFVDQDYFFFYNIRVNQNSNFLKILIPGN
jgi:hypothetical protein